MKRINILTFILILICLLCVASTCRKERDDCHYNLWVVNNSSKGIYTGLVGTSGDFYSHFNCDTSNFHQIFGNPYNTPHTNKIEPGEKKNIGIRPGNCIETWINGWCGAVYVYVFDAEVLETVPWDTVGKYYMVLKTIRPTIEDMQNNNWTITYTGE